MDSSPEGRVSTAPVRFEGTFDPNFSDGLARLLERFGYSALVEQRGSGIIIEFEALVRDETASPKVQTNTQQLSVIKSILEEAREKTRYKGRADQGSIEFTGIQRIISNRFFSIVVYKALFPTKAEGAPFVGDYHVIRWSNHFPAGATAIPITHDGKMLFVREMNPAFGFASWKLPTGSRELDEDLSECALREGREEAGLIPTSETKLLPLGDVAIDPNVIFDGARVVVITNVGIGAVDRDATESICSVGSFTLLEVENMIEKGEIFDGLSLSAICRLLILLRRDEGLRTQLKYKLE